MTLKPLDFHEFRFCDYLKHEEWLIDMMKELDANNIPYEVVKNGNMIIDVIVDLEAKKNE